MSTRYEKANRKGRQGVCVWGGKVESKRKRDQEFSVMRNLFGPTAGPSVGKDGRCVLLVKSLYTMCMVLFFFVFPYTDGIGDVHQTRALVVHQSRYINISHSITQSKTKNKNKIFPLSFFFLTVLIQSNVYNHLDGAAFNRLLPATDADFFFFFALLVVIQLFEYVQEKPYCRSREPFFFFFMSRRERDKIKNRLKKKEKQLDGSQRPTVNRQVVSCTFIYFPGKWK